MLENIRFYAPKLTIAFLEALYDSIRTELRLIASVTYLSGMRSAEADPTADPKRILRSAYVDRRIRVRGSQDPELGPNWDGTYPLFIEALQCLVQRGGTLCPISSCI